MATLPRETHTINVCASSRDGGQCTVISSIETFSSAVCAVSNIYIVFRQTRWDSQFPSGVCAHAACRTPQYSAQRTMHIVCHTCACDSGAVNVSLYVCLWYTSRALFI